MKEGGEEEYDMVRYIITDARTGEQVVSYQSDASAAAENAAVRESGIPVRFALAEVEQMSTEASRLWVGRRVGDAR